MAPLSLERRVLHTPLQTSVLRNTSPETCQVSRVEDDPISHLRCEEWLQHVEHHVKHPEVAEMCE